MKRKKRPDSKDSSGSSSDWEPFDDCLVCLAMGAAEQTGHPLKLEQLQSKMTAQNRLNEKRNQAQSSSSQE